MGLAEYREKVKAGIWVKKEGKESKIPSRVKAMRDKCKDCMCDYVDGRIDCEIERCSIYYWMPYGRLVKERRNK